jgi:single-stranded DNA-binding protein
MLRESGCQWVRVFVRLAEGCENVKKGLRVFLYGKHDKAEYADKEGQKRSSFRILADTYRLLQTQRRGSSASPLLLSWQVADPTHPVSKTEWLCKRG